MSCGGGPLEPSRRSPPTHFGVRTGLAKVPSDMAPRRALLSLISLGAVALACSPSSSGGGGGDTVVVVGIQGEEVASTVQNIHYIVKVPGQPDIDKTVDVSKLPIEEQVFAGSDKAAEIDVKVDGLIGTSTVAVERLASSRFVAIRVDATDDENAETKRLQEKYKIVGLPTVLMLDRNGNEVVRFNEFVEPGKFVAAMRRVTQGDAVGMK